MGEPLGNQGEPWEGSEEVRFLSVFQTYCFENAVFIGCMQYTNATLGLLLWDQHLLNARWGA